MLGATAGVGVGAAFLAACGGGSEPQPARGQEGRKRPPLQAVGQHSQAKPGGTLKNFAVRDMNL